MTSTYQLTPVYDIIDQFGLESVATFGALQLKFEGIGRQEFGEQYFATVAGFEYTFFDVGKSGADIGFLAEHLSDSRSSIQPPTIYDHDIFVGTRLSLNDTGSTHFLAGFLYDYRNGAEYASGKFSTRLRFRSSMPTSASSLPIWALTWMSNWRAIWFPDSWLKRRP